MNAIEFDKPVPIQFHGGRWDGMEIEMKLAPEIVHIDPNGQGVAKTDPNAPPLTPGWTVYLRYSKEEKHGFHLRYIVAPEDFAE